MVRQDPISTAEIRSLFTKEIENMGGTVRDAYDDGTRLFLRSILPTMREVRRDDRMQSGVALRMDSEQICVHPYLFRLVCKNGAIWAHALQTCRIDYRDALSPEQVERSLADSIRACGSEEAFRTAVREIRSAQETQADLILNMMPLLSNMPEREAHGMLRRIMSGFLHAEDPSRFGLMNAITAIARDTTDPELRWNLEEYGGGIPAALLPSPVQNNSGAEAMLNLYEAILEEQYAQQMVLEEQFDELLRANTRAGKASARGLETQEPKTLVLR
jgi:hypothetical protein